MTPEQRKEEISKAYVAAVAARCGFALGTWSQDHGGLDVTLGAPAPLGRGHLSRPKMDLQLKCTSRQDLVRKKGHVSWQFEDAQRHDALVARSAIPLFLVVMVLPADESEWIAHSPEELLLRRCAYHLLMTGRSTAQVAKPTVQIPLDNCFSPHSVAELMAKISEGTLP